MLSSLLAVGFAGTIGYQVPTLPTTPQLRGATCRVALPAAATATRCHSPSCVMAEPTAPSGFTWAEEPQTVTSWYDSGLRLAGEGTESEFAAAVKPPAAAPAAVTVTSWYDSGARLADEATADSGAPAPRFDLAAYMEEKRVLTEEILDASLSSSCTQTELIIESMRYSLLAGGKRVRPMLCFAATEMFGGSLDAAKPAAVALEMIHTMSLIHDDLPAMDNDDLRRGKPTNHVLYGDDVAILAGDAMLSESFAHVARETKGVPAERVVKVLGILGDCVGPIGLAGGQVMDLKSEGKPDVGMDTLTWIHTHKTAALLKAAVACGAVLAGATDEEVALCEEYALKIGLAFQVADDILDVEASTEDLGKTAGKDEEVDKTTYPKLLGLERSKEVAAEMVDEAKAALAQFGDAAAPLNGLADYIIQRKN